MNPVNRIVLGVGLVSVWLIAALKVPSPWAWAESGTDPANVEAFAGFREEKPGTIHKITVSELPPPYATPGVDRGPQMVPRPANAWPQAPAGFKVQEFASGLQNPRLIRTAPNGDVFVAESEPGRILVYRGITSDGKPASVHVYASGLTLPFGIAFYPPGPNPSFVYIANTDSVIRFRYRNGDVEASEPKQVIVPNVPGFGRLRGGGHWTRDIVFSKDGKQMFVSVGSRTNVSDTDNNPEEYHRADILVANPDGSDLQVFAYGIRNPVGLAINPQTGQLWASVNERDQLGDNLPPDYITHVQKGGFYGWPWYYIGGHQDPRLAGKHPELRDKVIVPDVLLQPHNASLEMLFYEGNQFPVEYRGDAFAAEHGSWNRAVRTGYEVICVPIKDGHASGEYEDFLTGFVTPQGDVWGRPVGVATASDGSLLVTDDGGNCIWRVSYVGS
jgi:glucose/arabinose dehydrogenase